MISRLLQILIVLVIACPSVSLAFRAPIFGVANSAVQDAGPIDSNRDTAFVLLYTSITNVLDTPYFTTKNNDFGMNRGTANLATYIDSTANGTNNHLDFDGINDVATNKSLAGFDTTTGTQLIWVNMDILTTRARIIQMQNVAGNTPASGMFMETTTGNNVQILLITNGVVRWTATTTGGTLATHTNKWVMWALSHEGQFPQFYFDGVEQALTFTVSTDTNAWYAAMFDGSIPPDYMSIGAGLFGGINNPFNGQLYRDTYYSPALTPAEILSKTNTNPDRVIGIEDPE